MFDIGWSEILVIAAVAIVVVGPKELPRMLRTFGKTMGQVRRTANDFKRQFDEAVREAEREVDLEDTRKTLKSIGNPLADAKKDLDAAMRSPGRRTAEVAKPAAKPVMPTYIEETPEPEVHEAEPVKTGAAAPAQGSDAA
jgi:sec-independent protein translocase protein TatB